jgi:CheY-like chemotaxis protein
LYASQFKSVEGVPINPDVTVLLVEDEASVRQFVRRALEQAGYTVMEATNPHEALRLLEPIAGLVDLVLTDVMMPGMSGRLMAERLVSRYPGLRMLFMSGNDEIVQLVNAREGHTAILSKPFTPSVLVDRVNSMLDSKAA